MLAGHGMEQSGSGAALRHCRSSPRPAEALDSGTRLGGRPWDGTMGGRVRDTEPVHLLECADTTAATLLATGRKTRRLARRIGERHLTVPTDPLTVSRKTALPQGNPVS